MLIQPHTLTFLTTNKCTAACEHCCFGCSPKRTGAIGIERILSLIDEAAAVPSIRVVVFSGGECFLLGDDLDRAVARANAAGYITRCVTNGYWAHSAKATQQRIERLLDAGLKEINFSTGAFHARYVPVDRIIEGAVASAEAGLNTLVNVEICEQSDFDFEGLRNHPRISPLFEAGRLRLQRNLWIESDGTVPLSHDPEHQRYRDDRISACQTVMKVLAVTPELDLVACCGLHLRRIPDLTLGNVAERSIREALDHAPDDLLKIWLHTDGPERILQFVARHQPDCPIPEGSVHPCESCHYIYHTEQVREVLRRHAGQVEDEVMEKYMVSLAAGLLSNRVLDEFSSE